jgi:L-ascorbate metabolism protein UlaG (beta-lactamase superfamily)
MGKKEKRQIVCTSEVGMYFTMFRQIPPNFFAKMQPGGTKDFDFCKVTMVHSEQTSTCPGPNMVQIPGGNACGFVITIPNHDVRIYHVGDTSIFSDMKIIDDLYKPTHVLLPIGDDYSMNPREAAYAVKNFMPTPKTIIALYLGGKGLLETFDFDGFVKQCKDLGVTDKEFIHCQDFFGGKALIE